MSKNNLIPVFNKQSFKDAYFQDVDERTKEVRMTEMGFEIYRRNDFRYKCKQTIASNRLDFYLVFLVTGGEGIHTFGDREYYLKPGMLCFVSPGLITSWQTTVDDHAGFFCAFTSDFFQDGFADKKMISNLPFFKYSGSTVVQLEEKQTKDFNNLFEEIEQEYLSPNIHKGDLIRAFLNLIFQKAIRLVDNVSCQNIVEAGNASQRITEQFLTLFERDFKPLVNDEIITIKSISEYASELFVTQNHLNDTVKSVTGKTPGEFIRERTVQEASQLLLHTTLTISEIADLLRFEDPSYFSRFYRKCTGLTPKQQRAHKIP